MKKLLLIFCCLMLSYTYSQAQIVVYCETPVSAMGSKSPFTWAAPTGTSPWGTKDLNIPANSIKDTLMVVDDGTTGDSLGCNPLKNNLTGKIALVYRGSCEFGVKAKNAQDAGAVGVIIINNIGGAPISMGAGVQGANVIIPTVLITNVDGKALRAAIDAGQNVVVFIGNKFGFFNNDLGFYAIDVLSPKVTANPALISASATEFNVPMGGWIHNYGINSQTDATITAVISGADTYSATSKPAPTIAHGDSVFVSIPTYSSSSYKGLYHINYIIKYSTADDFISDNKFYASFRIDSLFSYARIDTVTKMPISSDHSRFADSVSPFLTCVHFRDANASRLVVKGIYSSAAAASPGGSIEGETIDVLVYEWNDEFIGLSDAAFPGTNKAWNLKEIGRRSYTYSNGMERKMVYMSFLSPVPLVNNKRYLFCNSTSNDTINLGFDTYYNYREGIFGAGGNDQPVSVVLGNKNNTIHRPIGFGTGFTSSVSAVLGLNNLSVNENDKSFDVTPFPNPASAFIRIPLKGMYGTAELKIMDMNGNIVNAQTVKVASQEVAVNVTGLSSGNYVFNMLFADGRNTTFKVVITK